MKILWWDKELFRLLQGVRWLIFKFHPQSLSLPIPACTCVSEHKLGRKRAFWASFHENERFQAKNRLYKSQHKSFCCRLICFQTSLSWDRRTLLSISIQFHQVGHCPLFYWSITFWEDGYTVHILTARN